MTVHRHVQQTGTSPSTFPLEDPRTQDENTVATTEYSPHQSTRRISLQLGVLCMSVQWILIFQDLYPHHIQHLVLQDYEVRLQFCKRIDAHSELFLPFVSIH